MVCVWSVRSNLYPVDANAVPRTEESLVNDMRNAKTSRLFKGVSPLLVLPYFEIIKGVDVDPMHIMWRGLVEKLMTLWFDPSFRQEQYSLREHMKSVDDNLKRVRLPSTFHKVRSIEKHWCSH